MSSEVVLPHVAGRTKPSTGTCFPFQPSQKPYTNPTPSERTARCFCTPGPSWRDGNKRAAASFNCRSTGTTLISRPSRSECSARRTKTSLKPALSEEWNSRFDLVIGNPLFVRIGKDIREGHCDVNAINAEFTKLTRRILLERGMEKWRKIIGTRTTILTCLFFGDR